MKRVIRHSQTANRADAVRRSPLTYVIAMLMAAIMLGVAILFVSSALKFDQSTQRDVSTQSVEPQIDSPDLQASVPSGFPPTPTAQEVPPPPTETAPNAASLPLR